MEWYWTPQEKAGVEQALSCSFVGAPDTVRAGLEKFIADTKVDEIMVAAHIYDHTARLRSFEIVAAVRRQLLQKAA
jgi:alkanesulfonate monooxygenase SsuD/methylene tetrahydromethanopterin reductase-like flavin-dependent oxidoreductase (luciferase family)